MRRPSIIKKTKKKVNGQILLDVKETQKAPTVSFSESLNKLQEKSLERKVNPKKKSKKKDKDKKSESNNESNNASSKNLPKSQNDIISMKNKRNSVSVSFNPKSRLRLFNLEEAKNDKDKKNNSNKNLIKERRTSRIEQRDKNNVFVSRRHSVQVNLGRKFAEQFSLKNKSKSGLARIDEIVIGQKNEQILNPFKIQLQKEEEQIMNPKINIIEELKRFDREQQYKMEKYIDKKQKRYFDLMNKKIKIYHPVGKDDKHDEKKNSKKNKNNKYKKEEISKIEEDESNESSNSSRSSKSGKPSKSSRSSYSSKSSKTSKLSKTTKSNNNNSNNRTITEENENESEKEDKNKENKANEDNNNVAKDNNDNKEKEDIEKDEFQKMKEKYLSKNIFTLNFPSTEYKIKYLDNYFQNESSSKNLFGNSTSKKEEDYNKANSSNLYNSIFRTPFNMKYSDPKRYDNYDLKSRSYNYVTPKKLFKNPKDNDFIYMNDYNSKYNNNNLSLSSNNYTSLSNRSLSNHKKYDEIDKAYKNIINSIDDTLNDINRRKNQGNYIRALSSSIDKTKPFSKSSSKKNKNSFRYLSLSDKNKYYKNICDKFDKYNGFKMTRRYIIKNNI